LVCHNACPIFSAEARHVSARIDQDLIQFIDGHTQPTSDAARSRRLPASRSARNVNALRHEAKVQN